MQITKDLYIMIPTDSITTSYIVSSPSPLPAQPTTERLVVVLEQQPCKQWTAHDDGECQGPLGGHKVRVEELAVEAKTTEEDEHEGIVNGIEGVRNVAQKSAHKYHGVQTDKAATEELTGSEALLPAVVVGISDDESGQHKEQIDSKVAMRNDVRTAHVEHVEHEHHQCCHSSQTVEEDIMWFFFHSA